MNPNAQRRDRRQHSRNALVSVAGLALAVLAESCSVGLLGLSGWFIAASAVAGASAYSVFSYLAPSGGVRAFALGRIATNYAHRVVLHAAALRRISAARLRFYDRAAAEPRTHGTWSGQSLDRVMADADTKGMALIQATGPMIVAAAMTAGDCLAVVLAGYPLVAASHTPILRATYDRRGLTVSDYWLPATPTRNPRQIELAVAAGQTLIVTGASGSGKTTLLNAIATTLRGPAIQPALGVVTAVLADPDALGSAWSTVALD